MEGDSEIAGKICICAVNVSTLAIGVTTIIFARKPGVGNSANVLFLQSLAAADVVQACGVMPLSVAAVFAEDWKLPDAARLAQSTLFNITWLSTLFSLTWLNIDHYVYSRKPARPVGRSAAGFWVVVIWGSAAAFSVPPLLLREAPHACSRTVAFCFLNWRLFYAYLTTSALILLTPPTVALLFTTFYVISPHFGQRIAMVGVHRVTMYHTNSLAVLATLLSWALMLIAMGVHDSHPAASFAAFWLGMASPLWRFAAYCFFARSVLSLGLVAKRCEVKKV